MPIYLAEFEAGHILWEESLLKLGLREIVELWINIADKTELASMLIPDKVLTTPTMTFKK